MKNEEKITRTDNDIRFNLSCPRQTSHPPGPSRSNKEVRHWRVEKDTICDVLIRVLWERQIYTIIGVIFGDDYCVTYNKGPLRSLLDWWEKVKNDKHGNHWHKQWKHFYRFVIFVDRMLGKEA